MINNIKSLIKDSGIYGISSVLTSMVGIFLIPIYTRVFTPAEYGIVDVIATLSGILTIIIVMGFQTAQTFFYFDTDNLDEKKSIIATTLLHRLVTSILICLIMFIFAENLSNLIFKNPSNAIYIQLALITVIFSVTILEIQDVQRITQKPWGFLQVTVGLALLQTLLAILLIYIYNYGLLGLYSAFILSSASFCVLGLISIRKNLSFSISLSKMLSMLKYALPLVPGGLSIWMMNFADRYVLLQYVDLNEIGIYSLAVKAGIAISFIGVAFRLSWNPIAFSLKDKSEGPIFYSLVFKWYFLLLIVICTFISLFAIEALKIFATPAYYEAHCYVGPIAFSQVAWNLIPILTIGCLFMKKTKINLFAFGIASIVNIILNLLFVPHYGVMASALTTLVSFTLAIVIFIHYSQKYYPIPYKWRDPILLCVMSGSILITGYFLDQTYTIMTTIYKIFLFVGFILLIFIFSIINKGEMAQIKKYSCDIFQKLRIN